MLLVVLRLFQLVGSGHCRLCLTRGGSFQVVSCLLQVVSGCFLLDVGRCWSFQVVSCTLQIVSGRFLFFVGRFRSFLVLVSTVLCTVSEETIIVLRKIKMKNGVFTEYQFHVVFCRECLGVARLLFLSKLLTSFISKKLVFENN